MPCWRAYHTVTCNLMSSRPIKTNAVQLHGWTATCTPSHSEDKQLFTSAQSARWYCCCIRSSAVEGFMLAQKVWAIRCALYSRQAQSIDQAFHVSNCRNGFATCAAESPSVTWKVLAQSAAVITLLLLQHEACNQCLTTSVRTTSRARDRIHRLQHEPTFQGFGANSIDFRHDNRVAAVVPGLCASNTAHHGNNQLRKTCHLLAGWSGLFGNGQCSHWTQGTGHFRAAREARTAEARGQSKQSDHKIVLHPLFEYNVRSMALIATASAHRITKFFIRICNAAPHRPNCGGAAF